MAEQTSNRLMMRAVLGVLAALLVLVQCHLLLSDDGYRKTRSLRATVAAAKAENAELHARNAALEGEVVNLKTGLEAAEERARSDLGMIGANESFYQVVPLEHD
jgi:cell division protein FtsB